MKKSILFTLILTALLLTACGTNATTPAPVSALEINSNSSVVAEGTLLPDPSVKLSFAQPGIVARDFSLRRRAGNGR